VNSDAEKECIKSVEIPNPSSLSVTWSPMYSAEPEAEVVGEERGGLDQADARDALPNSCVWK